MRIQKYSNTIATLLFAGTTYLAGNSYLSELNELELFKYSYLSVSYQACEELESAWKSESNKKFKKIFYKYSLQFHPDKNPGSPQAEEIFKIISDCYTDIPQAGRKKSNWKLNRDRYLRDLSVIKNLYKEKKEKLVLFNSSLSCLSAGYLLVGNYKKIYKKIKPWQSKTVKYLVASGKYLVASGKYLVASGKYLVASAIEKAASAASGTKALAISFKAQLVNQYEKGIENFYKFYKQKLIKEIKKSWEDNRTIEKNLEEVLGDAWENDFENLADDWSIINARRDELIGKLIKWNNYFISFRNSCPTVQENIVEALLKKNIPIQNGIKAQQEGIDVSQIKTNGWVIFEGIDYNLKDLTWPSKLEHNRSIVVENRKYDDLLNKINQAQTETEVEEIDITQIKENLLTTPRSKQVLITAKDTRKNKILNEIAKALTKAKVQAKSKDADGNDWDPPLTLAEIEQIENTNDLSELSEIQQRFKVTREEFKKIPEPKKDEKIPFPTPGRPLSPKQKKVFGEDYLDLKLQQQQKRKKVVEEWSKKDHKDQKKNKGKENKRESVCSACQKSFPWDINLAFNPARKKAEKELKAHQKVCSLMSDPEKVKKVLQEKWRTESRNSRIHNAYSCRKCWGKIYWDKNILGAVEAKLHAIADLIYHEKHECSTELTKPKIAIYFSPNEGGNEHAPLSYAEKVDESELYLEKIYEMELSQKQVSRNSIVPWVIGGSLLFVGFSIFFYVKKQRNT